MPPNYLDEKEIKEILAHKKELLNKRGEKELLRLENVFHQKTEGKYVADVILGANDGIITTFVIVAGATGAGLPALVIIALGFANLLGDGASMGFGNYLGKQSEARYNQGQRAKEKWEIDHLPDVEKYEIKELFQKWGFVGRELERAVEIVSSNEKVWIDIMMREELGIVEEEKTQPAKSGFATFVAFVIGGAVPLLPFLMPQISAIARPVSTMLAGVTLFSVGALRSLISPQQWFKGGLEMLVIGGISSALAYFIGTLAEKFMSSFY